MPASVLKPCGHYSTYEFRPRRIFGHIEEEVSLLSFLQLSEKAAHFLIRQVFLEITLNQVEKSQLKKRVMCGRRGCWFWMDAVRQRRQFYRKKKSLRQFSASLQDQKYKESYEEDFTQAMDNATKHLV